MQQLIYHVEVKAFRVVKEEGNTTEAAGKVLPINKVDRLVEFGQWVIEFPHGHQEVLNNKDVRDSLTTIDDGFVPETMGFEGAKETIAVVEKKEDEGAEIPFSQNGTGPVQP